MSDRLSPASVSLLLSVSDLSPAERGSLHQLQKRQRPHGHVGDPGAVPDPAARARHGAAGLHAGPRLYAQVGRPHSAWMKSKTWLRVIPGQNTHPPIKIFQSNPESGGCFAHVWFESSLPASSGKSNWCRVAGSSQRGHLNILNFSWSLSSPDSCQKSSNFVRKHWLSFLETGMWQEPGDERYLTDIQVTDWVVGLSSCLLVSESVTSVHPSSQHCLVFL